MRRWAILALIDATCGFHLPSPATLDSVLVKTSGSMALPTRFIVTFNTRRVTWITTSRPLRDLLEESVNQIPAAGVEPESTIGGSGDLSFARVWRAVFLALFCIFLRRVGFSFVGEPELDPDTEVYTINCSMTSLADDTEVFVDICREIVRHPVARACRFKQAVNVRVFQDDVEVPGSANFHERTPGISYTTV